MDVYFLYTQMKLSILMSNYDVSLDLDSRNSLSLIISRISKNSTILEFGPANGRMTKYLKETLDCTVYAVELDKDAAKDAASFCEDILVADIEEFKWLKKYQHIEFDYIIFADVLEHLYDPQTVLTKAKRLLKIDGSVLMSLPNIAHNAIIMDLLDDKFTYRKTGLLDNTHIRFFTKNTLEELITKCGLEIAFETASYEEPSNTEFKNNYADLDGPIANLLSSRVFGEAYQFIFEAKHKAHLLETDFFQEDLASLYIDTGKGFNELEKVTTIFNCQSDKVISFTLEEGFHNVTAVRIDPLEMDLSLKVKILTVNGIDETNNINHNAIATDNNELKFLNNDPQLSINLGAPITLRSVVLEYEFLTKSYTTKDENIELQAQTVKSQEQQLQEKDSHLAEQAQQIETLNDTILAHAQTVKNQEQQLQEKGRHLAEQAQQIETLNDTISAHAQTVKNQEQQLQEKGRHLAEQAQQVETLNDTISAHAQTVKSQEQQLQEKDSHLAGQVQHVEEFDMKKFNLEEGIQSMRLVNRVKRLIGVYRSTEFCRKELPNDYSLHFDSDGYLKANPDVAEAVDDRVQESALAHFCEHGFEEILKGDRRLLENIPFYNDENYKNTRTDVTEAINNGSFKQTHYVHYLLYGHKELQKEVRQKKRAIIKSRIMRNITDKRKLKIAISLLRQHGIKPLLQKIIYHPDLTQIVNSPISIAEPKKIARDTLGKYSLSLVEKINTHTYIEPQRPIGYKDLLANTESTLLFSIIVPVYNISEELLSLLIDSIYSQWYPHWELILIDDASSLAETHRALSVINDARVQKIKLENNSGISEATNVGLRVAKGDYIIFADHDDELTPDCLYELEKCIRQDNPDFIYSDEDKIDELGNYVQPHFKPDWSPDTMMSTMFTGHISCFKHSLLKQVGELRGQFNGCQDWDFVLRFTEHTTRISHIPKILYHWRIIPHSIAADLAAKPYVLEASKKVREGALTRRNLDATVEELPQGKGYFRLNYHLKGTPLISIIIPTRDNTQTLQTCIDSIQKISSYTHYEIIIIDNGSITKKAISYFKQLTEHDNIRVIKHDIPFNYSELNNIGVEKSKGEILLFLNDDTEILQADWLERLGGYSQLPHIGAVGAKLMYSGGGLIQHAGVLNLEEGPGHAFLKQDPDSPGYFMRSLLEYNWLAVTGACLMVMKDKFLAIDGFSEELPIAYNDIDFCMRLHDAGFYNVVCQSVRLIHYESVSRGADDVSPEKIARLKNDKILLYNRNPKYFQKDPFYNLNLHPNGINFEGVE